MAITVMDANGVEWEAHIVTGQEVELIALRRELNELKREVAELKRNQQPVNADAVERAVTDRLIDIIRRA